MNKSNTSLLALLSLLLFIHHINGDADSHDHAGSGVFRYEDNTLPDCICITGIDNKDINCDKADKGIQDSQSYIDKASNNCLQACKEGKFDNENTFRCLQYFSFLVQIHSFCPTNKVNETLIHIFLDECPDCLEKPYNTPSAPKCSEELDCNSTMSQQNDAQYVLDNCRNTASSNPTCTPKCNETWYRVQGYHRMCSHKDLSEKFDEIYDDALKTAVCNYECNVPHTLAINCTHPRNKNYKSDRDKYPKPDIDLTGGSQKFFINIIGLTFIIIGIIYAVV